MMEMKMTDEQKRESLESARMNFDNLEKAYPAIKKHPLYKIARIQLDHGLGYRNADFDEAEKELGFKD